MMNKYNKLELIMNSVIMAMVIIIIALFFWPNEENKTQSNKIDVEKIQIKIIAKRINIRENPTIESKDIGDVYQDEIYTVIDHIDKEDYYWYKITTNYGVTGYIASDPKSPYVEIISGVIDRTPPEITVSKDFLIFNNGEVNYNDVICIDDYSTCNITHDNTDSSYITLIAKDDAENESRLKIRYYNVYNTYSTYYEFNKYINATYNKKTENNKILIEAKYDLNKKISTTDKSINYSPVITLFDENFNEINNIEVQYTMENLEENCINSDFSLKEEYIEKDLLEQNRLCINYLINDIDNRVKYFAVGFTGVENYNRDENYLANYYSKYYMNNN